MFKSILALSVITATSFSSIANAKSLPGVPDIPWCKVGQVSTPKNPCRAAGAGSGAIKANDKPDEPNRGDGRRK